MTDTNNGWPGKPGVPLDTPEGNKLKMDAGIPHLPTQLTYDCRTAIGGNGPLAYTWQDKPHRLVYDLCREIERIAAGVAPDQATALQARIAELEAALQDAARVLHKAGEQFSEYAKKHAAYRTAVGDLKAAANQQWAQRCFNAHDAALAGRER